MWCPELRSNPIPCARFPPAPGVSGGTRVDILWKPCAAVRSAEQALSQPSDPSGFFTFTSRPAPEPIASVQRASARGRRASSRKPDRSSSRCRTNGGKTPRSKPASASASTLPHAPSSGPISSRRLKAASGESPAHVHGSSSRAVPDLPRIRNELGATIAPGKIAMFHPLLPARRQASDGYLTALTRRCLLIARPSCCSRVGETAVRQGCRRSSVDNRSALRTAGLERSTMRAKST
jgi:hypothetical protein